MSIEMAALERVLNRDTRVATEEILAQAMLETGATSAVLFLDRGGINLKGGVGVDQECLDRVYSSWATDAAQLREGHPLSCTNWGLWPCATPAGLVLLYLSGKDLRLAQVRRTMDGIARLLALLAAEPRTPVPPASAQTAVDLYLRSASAEEVERRQLTILLDEAEWNIALAARKRGVTRVTLYKWMRRLGVERLRLRRGLKILLSEAPQGADLE